MLSLLHQTTLTITAALVLISCATQAQILNAPNLYARRYIEGKAAEEGLLDLQWVDGGVGRASSIAQLTYGGKPAYMTCTSLY
ncbi:hypothetical protein BDF22DRAFT_702461 [Syncephalis plumigaleata]|nr:hypothetical protein BDF22DRAFT_702461 [Syncephalis plumigaleata]